MLGAAGIGAAYGSIEEKILLAATQDGSAESRSSKTPKTDIPPGSLPCGKIGSVTLSRLVLGGNLIGGWAHSRDLMYASKLFKSYNTEAKVFETLELAQACGINTIQIDPRAWAPMLKYNRNRAAKIQLLTCLPLLADKTKMNDEVKLRVDQGATMLYSHGGDTDKYFMNGGRIDAIGQVVGSDQGRGRAGRSRRPLAGSAQGVPGEQARPRFLRQDLSYRPLLVGHAQTAAEGISTGFNGGPRTTTPTTTACGATIPRRRRPSWRRSRSRGWRSR